MSPLVENVPLSYRYVFNSEHSSKKSEKSTTDSLKSLIEQLICALFIWQIYYLSASEQGNVIGSVCIIESERDTLRSVQSRIVDIY